MAYGVANGYGVAVSGGVIEVTGNTGYYLYNGVNSVIEYGDVVVIEAATGVYSYTGIDADAQLSGVIIIDSETGTYTYDGIAASVSVFDLWVNKPKAVTIWTDK